MSIIKEIARKYNIKFIKTKLLYFKPEVKFMELNFNEIEYKC